MSGRYALIAFLLCASYGVPLAGEEPRHGTPGYEAQLVYPASEIVPSELRSGPHHKVDERVVCRDYLHHYTIESDFGSFDVRGDAMLAIRVHEIHALARMNEISRSEVFQDALVEAAKSPFVTAKNVIVRPVSTVTGLPGGVARYLTGLFRKTKKGAREVAEALSGEREEAEQEPGSDGNKTKSGAGIPEKHVKSFIGYNSARRKLARRLGVDPYSSNPRLQEELDRLAWASFAGGFAAASVPRIRSLDMAGKVSKQVWNLSPEELERRNGKKLKKMGVERDLRWKLFCNESYSITLQTFLVDALKRMRRVEGRPGFIELAAEAESVHEARFLVRVARILAGYHENVGPLRAISTEGGRAFALTPDGAIIVPAAVDVLPWTEAVDRISSDPRLQGERREAWLSGHATPRARQELEDRGWIVEERCFDRH